MSTQRYYEQYWADPGKAPPARDPLQAPRLALLFPHLCSESKVLDVGCGDGRVTQALRTRSPRTVGVDISLAALRAARGWQPDGRWVCSSLEFDLPFPQDTFDVVHCCEIIEHLLDVATALAAMHRVLRPGGLLFLSTPYHGLGKNLAIALFGFERHYDPVGPHIRFFTVNSLRRLLHQTGFRLENTKCLGRFWPVWKNLVAWARKK